MLNIEEFINLIDVEQVMEHYGFNGMERHGDSIRSACKLHDGDNTSSFVMNTDTCLWYCHTNCGGGDVFSLVQMMEKCTFLESVKILANMFKIDISSLKLDEAKVRNKKELSEWMNIHKMQKRENSLKECKINYEGTQVKNYREFKEQTLIDFDVEFIPAIGFTNKNGRYYTLNKVIAFPVYFDNKRIAISFRSTVEGQGLKWSHQPRDINIGMSLYNYDNVIYNDLIVIVEGILDVMAFHEIGIGAVATFGAHITDEQINLLLKTGADFAICYDNDKAGRLARKKFIDSFHNKATMYNIELPLESDPENIPRSELLNCFNNRTKITNKR